MDRSRAPQIQPVDSMDLLPLVRRGTVSGRPLYEVIGGQQEVVRVAWSFRRTAQDKMGFLAEQCVNAMLRDGTGSRDFRKIAMELDAAGGHLDLHLDSNRAYFILYALSKGMGQVTGLVRDILTDSNFPESPFNVYVGNQIQRCAVNDKKVASVARKAFVRNLFGNESRLGFTADAADWKNLKQADLMPSFQDVYGNGEYVMVAGRPPEGFVSMLEEMTPDLTGKTDQGDGRAYPEPVSGPVFVEVKDAVQSAIRMGKRTINKTHADYPGLSVLSTILGGYFGSRLMKNIREEKGFTYGIGSGLVSAQDTGYFYIATEVGSEVCADALKEIRLEIKKLRAEVVSESELNVVRSYMLGSLMRSADGPFGQADLHCGMLHFGLDESYLRSYVSAIKTIGPEEIRDLAQRYIDPADMLEVVAGPRAGL